jgi:hypothetical protein
MPRVNRVGVYTFSCAWYGSTSLGSLAHVTPTPPGSPVGEHLQGQEEEDDATIQIFSPLLIRVKVDRENGSALASD